MFLLNNIHDRRYAEIYQGTRHVAFDLSESQIQHAKNGDWANIAKGSIVCVVNSTRKISTFRRVEEKRASGVVDETGTILHVIIGSVIGRLPDDIDMTTLLNKYDISHRYLPQNVFSIGFNVASLGQALDDLSLKTKNGVKTLAELKSGA